MNSRKALPGGNRGPVVKFSLIRGCYPGATNAQFRNTPSVTVVRTTFAAFGYRKQGPPGKLVLLLTSLSGSPARWQAPGWSREYEQTTGPSFGVLRRGRAVFPRIGDARSDTWVLGDVRGRNLRRRRTPEASTTAAERSPTAPVSTRWMAS